jgi:hypothetical protein
MAIKIMLKFKERKIKVINMHIVHKTEINKLKRENWV